MKKLYSTTLLLLALAPATLAQKAVTNLTSGTEFDGLSAAITAASSGDVIQINSDITFNTTANPGTKEITIQGATPETTVRIGKNSKGTIPVVINVNSTGSLTVKDLTFDVSEAESSTNFAQQTNGTLNIDNITISNYSTTATNGAVRIYTSPVATVIDNLRFENCSLPATAAYHVLNAAAASTLTIKGQADYTVRLNNKDAFFTDGGITTGSKTNISYSSHTETVPVVKGTDDIFKFNLEVAGKMLAPTGSELFAVNAANVLLINGLGGDNTTSSTHNGLTGSAGPAAASILDGAVIAVNGNANLTSAMSLGGKTVEIRGYTPEATITITSDKAVANAGAANTHITLRDLVITKQADLAYTTFLAQATTADASVTFRNVTFKDCSTTNAALIRANANGVWHLDGVTFDNCAVTTTPAAAASRAGEAEATPLVLTNNPGCSVSGINNGLTIQINNAATNSLDAAGLEMGNEPVKLTLAGGTIHDRTLITNCDDPALFEITNSGWSFQNDDNGGLKTLDRQIVTGIEDVEAEADGEAEYYDLRGIRINAEALAPGIYLRRQNGKVEKVAIR